MPRLLTTDVYEKTLSRQQAKDAVPNGVLPPGTKCKTVATPGSRARSIKKAVEGTANSEDPATQLRHELLKNRFDLGGAKQLLEIAAQFGQTLQEFAEDKLIFDLEMELVFSNTVIWDLSGRGMFPAGAGPNNFGNAGGYPSTTGNPSGGGRSNGPRSK